MHINSQPQHSSACRLSASQPGFTLKNAVKMEVVTVSVYVCRFIGELFKLKMLTEGIMHDCIRRLLRAWDEESLECLCRLLTTIGCDLDKDRTRVSMRRRL